MYIFTLEDNIKLPEEGLDEVTLASFSNIFSVFALKNLSCEKITAFRI
jgi:hypothetical protein